MAVHRQLSRNRVQARLKAAAAEREVILAPGVVRPLRERWLATLFKTPDDLAFSATGRGLTSRRVGDALRIAVHASWLRRPGRLSLHSLRHGQASLLIGKAPSVVFVSRHWFRPTRT